MANVFFNYIFLHSICLLHFLFLCFHLIHIRPQTEKLFYNFLVKLILHFIDYFFVLIIIEWSFFLIRIKIEQMLISKEVFFR